MKGIFLAALALAATAAAAPAVEVTRTAAFAAPPATAWKKVGGFCGLAAWHPAVRSCTVRKVDGVPVRTVTLNGGADLIERQVAWDDAGMSYTYTLLEGPLPVENYVATLAVTPEGAGSRVTLTGTFVAAGATDAEAADLIGEIYAVGLDGLAASLK